MREKYFICLSSEEVRVGELNEIPRSRNVAA